MIELIKNNKIVSALVLLIIVFSLLLIKSVSQSKITFYLNGDQNVVISKDSDYVDPLFVAYDKKNNISNYVDVSGYVNTSITGTYEIKYVLNYKDYHMTLTRYVNVMNSLSDKYEIVLNGNDVVYVLVGTEYIENGAYVINALNGLKNSDVEISSNINTNLLGEYIVKYSYNSPDGLLSINRKVIVFDLRYSLVPQNDDMLIVVSANDVENYFYTKLPNGKYSYDEKISFLATANNDYYFTIYDLNGNNYQKKITVNNIIKNYYCNAQINIDGTTLQFNKGNNSSYYNIKEYKWVVDGSETITTTNSLKLEKIVNNASVNIIMQDGSNNNITCTVFDNLAYHFKYDENNTKAFMNCSTYTSNEKVMLDNMLSNAVSLAGYGTRAGVVEAARFIVGALDYKIPYLGPKTFDPSLGKYPYKGLNIGSKNAWGCMVSGWLQGLDCTNFISWAFAQNGLVVKDIYGTTNTYSTRSVVNRLRVGDLLLTPCQVDCDSSFQHVGIIIGIDDNYIYVAEATTSGVDATIVSKWDKNNMPKKDKFSVARLYEYRREGNITNMWLS